METTSLHKQNENLAQSERELMNSSKTAIISIESISWSSIIAGMLIAIVIQICLSLLGIGIGLSTIDAKTETNPTDGLGIGTGIWYFLSSLISVFAGAWIAGRLAQTRRLFDGIIHGLLTWSLITLVTLYFLSTTIGSIIGGASKLVGNTLGVAGNLTGKGIAAMSPAIEDELKNQGFNLDDLKSQAKTLLRQTGKSELQPNNLANSVEKAGKDAKNSVDNIASDPKNSDSETDSMFEKLMARGKGVVSEVDKEAMVNVIVARTGKSRAEANKIADNWIATAKQTAAKWEETKKEAEIKARQVADDAAKASSIAAILTFFSLALGAVVAGYGAKKGTESKEYLSKMNSAVVA